MTGSADNTAGGASALLQQIRSDLEVWRGLTSSLIGDALPPLPPFGSVGEVKEFCVGLLDPGSPHPWRGWASRAPEAAFFRAAHSLFLFRKTLPAGSESVAIRSFLDRVCTDSPASVDPLFLQHLTCEVQKALPHGWDRGYNWEVNSLTLPVSACLEAGRAAGGVRTAPLMDSTIRKAKGLDPAVFSRRCRVQAVRDGPKWRVVTVNSADAVVLRPLHHLLYNRLSRQPWLLRGEPTLSHFRAFGAVDGEVFVSGDYEAATDNIPLEVYTTMLSAARATSTTIPQTVWDAAFRDSSKIFVNRQGKEVGCQKRGQLMGSLLSFPFLCLLNYAAFKWAVPRDVPVKINGDDIVWRGTAEECDRWFRTVQSCGLVLSQGKTLVHPRYFTLNSCLFRGRSRGASAEPFVRSAALFTKPDTVEALVGQLGALVKGAPGSFCKQEAMVWFLKRHRALLDYSQLALTRDLHARVPAKVMRIAGLFDRERFYLGLPAPPPPGGGVLPGGFTRQSLRLSKAARRRQRVEEGLFFREVAELSWLYRSPSVRPCWRGTVAYRPKLSKTLPGWIQKCKLFKAFKGSGRSVYLGKLEPHREERRTVWARPLVTGRVPFVFGGVEGG